MQYEYDSWNRIQEMTYPDGEVVHYDYNRGGMLKKVYGTVTVGVTEPPLPEIPHDSLVPLNLHGLGGQASLNSLPPVGDPVPLYDTHTYSYIDSIAYNEFELKIEVFYGNGTHALYAYDSLLRLLLLQSQTRTGDIMQDIVYTYDSVGNITSISNGAGMLPNGLGGTYNSAYTYDDLYRLTSSTGGWQGSQNISYRTTTLYRGNGRIKQKNLAARKLLNGVSDSVNYSHYYHYENTSQPNTLTRYSSSVWDPGSWLSLSNEDDSQFGWNSAGNMTESCIGGTQNCRDFCWDEQNRLQGVKDKRWLSYYQYDAAGDRTYKLTGKGDLQNISGIQQYYYLLENATLYASPYLVATDKGYTKHYYAESERLASRIGGGRLSDLDHPTVDQDIIIEREELFSGHIEQVLKNCLNTKHFDLQTTLYKLYDWRDSLQTETDCYWYHPDHLGSSSWVTDTGGTAVQHLHYLPWGEDYVNQRLNSFDGVRYTFSAKEKDSETGLSYFGSRYYSSDLSVWLSVDPMSDKYPSTSPYAYCRNNPIILVDDNGNKDRPFNPEKDQGQTILQNINTPFSYVFDSKGRKIGYSISNYFTCYNCHSYAWNNSLGSKYSKAVNYLGLALSGGGVPFGIDFIQNYAYVLPRWNNDPTNDILEQGARQMLNTENNQVGDRVIYYYDENGSEKYEPGEPIVHSAIVEEVDVNGYTTLVKAKCGEGPITVNHPDAPNYYSTYKDPAGESHKTRRAYFRIPATNNQQEP